MNFLQEFPAEAGKQDRDRILPYMPGPLDAVNDDITGIVCICVYVCVCTYKYLLHVFSIPPPIYIYYIADRARDLSKYCDDLIKLPRYLSESPWVQEQLFGIHEGDIETDIDPGVGRPVSNTYVTPVSTPTTPNITTPITATTPTTASTLTNATTSNTTIKVKIVFKDEIFAIKVPATCTIQVLESKIIDRLGFDAQLKLKDGNELHTLSDEAFALAISVGKLTVVAS